MVERLYDISAGVTEAIVAQGLDAEGALRLDESTFDQIAAHRHAADLVGDAVRAARPMSTGLLKEFHAAVTSAQPRYKSVDQFGRAVQGALLHGEYKTEDNHVRLPGGSVHHYAPAIQTASEVDRLVDFLAAAADEHPVRLAVFAHHRLTRIHPFQDGNGRAARLLATYYLIRGRFLPLTVTRDQRDAYFTALQHADAGDPFPLATFVVARQRDALLRVEQRAFSAASPLPGECPASPARWPSTPRPVGTGAAGANRPTASPTSAAPPRSCCGSACSPRSSPSPPTDSPPAPTPTGSTSPRVPTRGRCWSAAGSARGSRPCWEGSGSESKSGMLPGVTGRWFSPRWPA